MTRNPETREHWAEEVRFVETVDPADARFGGDPACFARYARMRARFAREDGFGLLAERMLARAASVPDPATPAGFRPARVPADLARWHEDSVGWRFLDGDLAARYYETVAPDGTFVACGLSVGPFEPGRSMRNVNCSRGDLDRGGQSIEKCRRDVFRAAVLLGIIQYDEPVTVNTVVK